MLIDGFEYAEHIISSSRSRNINHLGNYNILDNIIRDDLNSIKSSGLIVTMYLESTDRYPFAENIAGFNNMQNNMFRKQNSTEELNCRESLLSPTLFILQLKATLHSLGVQIIHTKGNSIQQMAKDCARANTYPKNLALDVITFCYGNNM